MALTLTYFNGPGRGELVRLALAAGDVTYEDNRIEQSAWPALKADASAVPAQMFGSMPCIQHGEFKLAQSMACAQYAADQGINLKNSPSAQDRALDTMMLGAHADLQTAMYACIFGNDESKNAGKAALPGAAATTLAGIERTYTRSAGTFLYGKSGPTLGDLAVFDVVTSVFPGLTALGVDLSSYAKINACVAACRADPLVKAYCDKRGF